MMVTHSLLSAESNRLSPVARAGHSAIRVPRAVAGLRGFAETSREMTDAEFLVYLAMVDLADNRSHRLALNTGRIAARAGVSLRTVQHVLKTGFLGDAGLIEETLDTRVVTVVAPTSRNGGYLSVARPALWKTPTSGIEMPAYVLQSLLVLIAHSQWSETSTTLTATRHRETMANNLISLDRFKRGLRHLDRLPWVGIESQRYDAALAGFGMARRMPTVRVIDWSLVAPYERAVDGDEPVVTNIPQQRVETVVQDVPAERPAPVAVVPQQRSAVASKVSSGAPSAPSAPAPVDASLLSWVPEGKGVSLSAITGSEQALRTLVSDTKTRLDQGWTLDQLRDYARMMLTRTQQVKSAMGWLRATGIPGSSVPVGEVPTMTSEEAKYRVAQAARAQTWDLKKSAMADARASVVVDESSPF